MVTKASPHSLAAMVNDINYQISDLNPGYVRSVCEGKCRREHSETRYILSRNMTDNTVVTK